MQHTSSASLPSDYGLLARFAAHRPDLANEHEEDDTIDSEAEDENNESLSGSYPTLVTARSKRPRSFRVPVMPPSMGGPLPDRQELVPNERTPLFSVPRIEENGSVDLNAENLSTHKAFWAEFAILIKYTIPVFGSVIFYTKHEI